MADAQLLQLKIQYNALLTREKKAEAYLDNHDIPLRERERWLPKFNEIMAQLNELLLKINNFTSDDVVNGFNI